MRRQRKPSAPPPAFHRQPRTDFGSRCLNFGILALVLIVAGLLAAPYLNSGPVRVEGIGLEELPIDTPSEASSIGTSVVTDVQPLLVANPALPALPGTNASEALPAIPIETKPVVPKTDKRRKTIDEFFNGPIVRLRFEFDPEEWEYLKKDHRRYVECSMIEEGKPGKTYKGVGVKLKGAAGSFQGPDGKPGLTVSFSKFKGAERFHGMSKFHLNNGVQDGTYLNEFIAGEMARRAGVPASRCTHAFVTLNGRDLGLFVFKEAFTDEFLGRYFEKAEGSIYDGGLCREIDENMEKDEGDPKDRSDVKELMAACREGDNAKRWERLARILDVDRYISFLAMEALMCHWDGYNFNRNNYRVHFNAGTGKAVFFMHGMDQMFGDSNYPVTRGSDTLVGGAVLSNPEWKRLYRERVEKIYNEVLKPTDWPARVTEVGEKVRAALQEKNPPAAKEYGARINEASSRVATRIVAIGKQLGDLPKPFSFDANGVAKITGDGWRQEGSAAKIDGDVVEGKPTLHIRADGDSAASWRKSITLEPGKYRVETRMRTAGVVPTQGPSGAGAGLRISGGTRDGQNAAKGDTPWQMLGYEFTASGGDVVLVAELRASKGEVWFERDAFRLVRVK